MSTAVHAAPRRRLEGLALVAKRLIHPLVARSNTPLLPFIPKSLKIILFLLVFLNAPSFPFQWHIRVWWHAIKAYWLVYKKGRRKYLDDWEAQNLKAGQIKGLRTRVKRIAWVDDCDYNVHLSNSCYGKNSDPARMDYCIKSMSPLFTPGVHMALAGSHYIFMKEIPMGSEYVMETRTIGWGEKWFYPVTEFIIYPKSKKSSKAKDKAQAVLTSAKDELDKKLAEASSSATGPVIPSVLAPATGESSPDRATGMASPISSLDEARRAALRNRQPRSDGGVVACLAVWEYCFKLGRQTIPPRIALYLAFQSPKQSDRDHARKLLFSKDQGRAWLKGGWKDEPNAGEIGKDIGVSDNDDGSWIERGRKAMEVMTDGLAAVE